MRTRNKAKLTLITQQSGHIQLLIVAPILTLSVLSLVVRTASSAVDTSVEKKKVTEQLKRRLSEAQNERSVTFEEQEDSSRGGTILVAKLLPTDTTLAKTSPQENHSPFTLQHDPDLLFQQLSLPLQVNIKIKKNMTLSSILSEEGIPDDESGEWLTEVKAQKSLKNLRIGRTITLSFVSAPEKGERKLQTIAYELDKTSQLVLEKKENGKINARKEKLPVTLTWKAIGGRISSSLYESAIQAGMPRRLFDDLIDMGWDIDFTSGMRQGDTFKVIFEEFQLQGKPVDTGKIIAAEINNKGKVHTLFSLGTGKNSGKNGSFLRYPLRFTRISSVFTDARLHPILERVRPHTGVDFAAPRGTPVRSIAEGKITFAGRQSGYGNMVKIDHPGRYDSAYAHLDRIAKSVRKGANVEKGDVIGYVGSTGLATGPHLHFEMYKDGAFVNPLTAKIKIEPSAPAKEDPLVAAKKKHALEQLSAMKIGKHAISLSLAVSEKFTGHEVAQKDQDERFALATSSTSTSTTASDVSSTPRSSAKKKHSLSKSSSRSNRASSRSSSSKRSKSVRVHKSARR